MFWATSSRASTGVHPVYYRAWESPCLRIRASEVRHRSSNPPVASEHYIIEGPEVWILFQSLLHYRTATKGWQRNLFLFWGKKYLFLVQKQIFFTSA